MSECNVCGTSLLSDATVCPICGTSLNAPLPEPPPEPPLAPAGPRQCPDCGRLYEAGHADTYCVCGGELRAVEAGETPALEPVGTPLAESVPALELPLEPLPGDLAPPTGTTLRPPAGTACLVVYSAERLPVYYQPLDQDVTRIGRTDAVRGDFVELDVGRLFDETTARKVSRKHALVLRSRQTQSYALRPLARNTGTQIEGERAVELQDYPLTDGTRILLGGTVRLKFEVMR
jgi:hypothetical protein